MMLSVSETENTSIAYFGKPSILSFKAVTRSELFASREFLEIINNFIDEFASDGGKLLSFDVFDTVLLRNEKSELRRFYEMATLFSEAARNEYGAQCNAIGILFSRLASTRISYQFSTPVDGCREGSLEEIHTGIARMLNLPDNFAKKLTEIELDYERRNLCANPMIDQLLDVAEKADLELVLISDMYMGKLHIMSLLQSHFPGVFREHQIFSSGDMKISKRSGRLFDHVASEHLITPDQALHLGDNLTTDYLCARSSGWQALYLPHSDKEQEAIDLDERKFKAELAAIGVNLQMLLPK